MYHSLLFFVSHHRLVVLLMAELCASVCLVMTCALGKSSISASHYAGGGTSARGLQALLAPGPLLIPLAIDHSREGVLKLPGNAVRDSHDTSQKQTSRLSVPERSREEAERRAVVHGRIGDVEGERCDWRVHQNAKVVAQICTGDAECPHRGQDERVASEEEWDRGVFDEGVKKERGNGLVGEGFVVAVEDSVSASFVWCRVWLRLERKHTGSP